MRRPQASDIVLKALGLLLLTAAVLKGHEPLTVPLLGKDIWSWRPFLIFQVEWAGRNRWDSNWSETYIFVDSSDQSGQRPAAPSAKRMPRDWSSGESVKPRDDSHMQWDSLVEEAHKHDPFYSQRADREKAVMFYRQAIDACPDHRLNVALRHRIAQMYAFYGDPDKAVRPDPNKAQKAFSDLLASYPISELDCLVSHIGLAGVLVLRGDLEGALNSYKKVADFDPNDHPQQLARMNERERAAYLAAVESAWDTAVKKIAYTGARIGPGRLLHEMSLLEAGHPNTPIGRKARGYRLQAVQALADVNTIVQEWVDRSVPCPASSDGNTISSAISSGSMPETSQELVKPVGSLPSQVSKRLGTQADRTEDHASVGWWSWAIVGLAGVVGGAAIILRSLSCRRRTESSG